MAGSASEKDKERSGSGLGSSAQASGGLKLGPSLVRAKKYIDADGMYAQKDKGNMGLRDYTCKRGQIEKIYYNWVCSVVRDALVVAGIRTPTPVQLYGPLAEINQEWSPNHDLPEKYDLKDAFRLISAKTSTNTVFWGNLSPLKQREIVKYARGTRYVSTRAEDGSKDSWRRERRAKCACTREARGARLISTTRY
ncbi:BQ5605_C006g03950 [Microbotryum silenes-dioicae]|uniref:BQ5605_C006g03950 protein n=1 Tax=Microbotryum silenes-dioicae TaxID=796604 RepID=A0A2X0MZS4_9BASI|nr:BQ5605_C006g03950 [Microbotryum silenes-dioicae]